MDIKEFEARTKGILTADEIAAYEVKYEPAYMAVQGVDKDDFCAILENPVARRFVIAVSETVVDLGERLKDAAREKAQAVQKWHGAKAVAEADHESLVAARDRAEAVAAKYKTALALMAAMIKEVGAIG